MVRRTAVALVALAAAHALLAASAASTGGNFEYAPGSSPTDIVQDGVAKTPVAKVSYEVTLPKEQMQEFDSDEARLKFKKAVCEALIQAEMQIWHDQSQQYINAVPKDVVIETTDETKSKDGLVVLFTVQPHGLKDYRHIKPEVGQQMFESALASSLAAKGFHRPSVSKSGEVTKRAPINGTVTCGPGDHVGRHRTVCLACEPGSYCMHEFRFLCPKGKFQNKARQTSCLGCGTHDYQNNHGMASCWPCPQKRPVPSHDKTRCCTDQARDKCAAPPRLPTPAPTPRYTSFPTPAPTPESQRDGCCKPGETDCCPSGKQRKEKAYCTACPAGQIKLTCGTQLCKKCAAGKTTAKKGKDMLKAVEADNAAKLPCVGCPQAFIAKAPGSATCTSCAAEAHKETNPEHRRFNANFARTRCTKNLAWQDSATNAGESAAADFEGNKHDKAAAAGQKAAEIAAGNDASVVDTSNAAARAAAAAGGSSHDQALAAGRAAGIRLAQLRNAKDAHQTMEQQAREAAHAAAAQVQAKKGSLFTALQAAAQAAGAVVGALLRKGNSAQESESKLSLTMASSITPSVLAQAKRLGMPKEDHLKDVTTVIGVVAGSFIQEPCRTSLASVRCKVTSKVAAEAAQAAAMQAAKAVIRSEAPHDGKVAAPMSAKQRTTVVSAQAKVAGAAAVQTYYLLAKRMGDKSWTMTSAEQDRAVQRARDAAAAVPQATKVDVAAAAGAAAAYLVVQTSRFDTDDGLVTQRIIDSASKQARQAVVTEYCGTTSIGTCDKCGATCQREQALSAGLSAVDVAVQQGLDAKETSSLAAGAAQQAAGCKKGDATCKAGKLDDIIAEVMDTANAKSQLCSPGEYWLSNPNDPKGDGSCVPCPKPAPFTFGEVGAQSYYCSNDLRRKCTAGHKTTCGTATCTGCALCGAGRYQANEGQRSCSACKKDQQSSEDRRCCVAQGATGLAALCPSPTPAGVPTPVPTDASGNPDPTAAFKAVEGQVRLPYETKESFGPAGSDKRVAFRRSVAAALKAMETVLKPDAKTFVVEVSVEQVTITKVEWSSGQPVIDGATPARRLAAVSRRLGASGGIMVFFKVQASSVAEYGMLAEELSTSNKDSVMLWKQRISIALNQNNFGISASDVAPTSTSPIDCSGFGLHPNCHGNIGILAGGCVAIAAVLAFFGVRYRRSRDVTKYSVVDADQGDEVDVDIGTTEEASHLTTSRASAAVADA